VDHGPDADRLLVEVGILLAAPGLVRGRHGLGQAVEQRRDRDALLSLEHLQRVHRLLVHLTSSFPIEGSARCPAPPPPSASPPLELPGLSASPASAWAPTRTPFGPSG